MADKTCIDQFWLEPIQGYDPWRNADDFYFDQSVAESVCEFFPTYLSHADGKFGGTPFILADWQKRMTGHLFGWKRKSDDTRRFREMFLYVPKKNGKTQWAAGIALLMLIADGEKGAQVYSASGDKDQAAIIFKAAASMVEEHPDLEECIIVQHGYRRMKFNETGSYWKVLSSEAKTKHGPNIHCLIIDEYHIQTNDELVETLQRGTIARAQPITLYLTTSAHIGDCPCNRMLEYCRKVRDGDKGVNDPYFLPVIYESFNDKDDWTDPAIWEATNPCYGITVNEPYFVAEVEKAKSNPAKENSFKRLHLNMQTEKVDRWMDMHHWDQSGESLTVEELDGHECFAGLDMSQSNDITALVLYFPKQCACLCWFWVPKETAERRLEYKVWKDDGYLYITQRRTIDQREIERKIVELSKQYKILDIAYDNWKMSQLAQRFEDEHGLPLIEFRQGYKSMTEPTDTLYSYVLDHKLVHFGNPVLRWMVGNARAQYGDAGAVKLVKENKDSPLKIDGIIALVMAFGLSLTHEKEQESAFESDDFDKLLEEMYGN